MVCGLASCTNIDNLSDKNKVERFAVSSHSPSEIELGEADITTGDVIYIPVNYGEEKFPMTFRADVGYEGKIDRVMGADFKKDLTFNSVDDEIDFIVVAESGLGRRYVIKPKAVAFEVPEQVGFSINSSAPAGALAYHKGILENDRMTLYMIRPSFPLTLTLEFDTEDKITFDGFDNGKTPLTFNTAGASHTIGIVDAEHGSKRYVSIHLEALEEVSGSEGGDEYTEIRDTDVASVALDGAEGKFEYMGFSIDHVNDILAIDLNSLRENAEFPVSLTLDIRPSAAFTEIVGLEGKISFGGFGEPVPFYYADSESGVVRTWNVVLSEYDDPVYAQADVTAFAAGYTASTVTTAGGERPAIELDMSKTQINAQNGEIILSLTDVANAQDSDGWRLELTDVEIEVSRGASFTMPALVWTGNGSWEQGVTFDVTARKGNKKTWTVRIRDSRTHIPNDECDITAVSIGSLLPTNVKQDPDEPVILYQEARRIYIKLQAEAYPLTARLAYTLSEGAKITSQNNNADPLVFNDAAAVNTVTVLSEDGENALDYQVRIISPVSLSDPDVRTFAIPTFSSPVFQTGGITVDTAAGEVVIDLDRGGKCPLTVNYRMTMERDVTADIPLEGSFSFKNLNEVKTFTATAGAKTKTWKVRFREFLPQLVNWELNNWTGDNKSPVPAGTKASPYWANANNSFVAGTSKTTGKEGGGAAKLTTGEVNILSIKRLTSGSIFLGWFNSSNIMGGLNDPVSLTFQGIEFSASRKIIGFEADIKYSASADLSTDTGSLAIELVRENSPSTPYVYHGNKPVKDTRPETWQPHPDNTARRAARGRRLIGNAGGTQDGETITKVNKGEWTTVRVELDYSGMADPLDYTHLIVICASSSRGDVFVGAKGSELIIDNFRLIYEE